MKTNPRGAPYLVTPEEHTNEPFAKGQFSRLAAAAVFDSRVTNRQVRVLAALASYSDKHGFCFPSVVRLATELGVTRNAVQFPLRRLEALGYVTVTPRHDRNGARRSNWYQLHYPEHQRQTSHLGAKSGAAVGATSDVAVGAKPVAAHNRPAEQTTATRPISVYKGNQY